MIAFEKNIVVKKKHRTHNEILQTISFIIFWDFPMFYKILLSPQLKAWAIITCKQVIYKLPHQLRNELSFRILGN